MQELHGKQSETAVLIVTEPDDLHAYALKWALAREGVTCDRWSLSEYPDAQPTSVRIPNSPSAPAFRIPGLRENYISVWLRRLGQSKSVSPLLAPADIPMANLQAQRSAEGIRSIFSPRSVWVNPLEARAEANSKPAQLVAARNAGFQIPETLISNDPDEIRNFWVEHNGDVICKFFTPAFWRREDGRVSGLFTARLDETLLDNRAAFTSCPAIYQTLIAKKADIRVVFSAVHIMRFAFGRRRAHREPWIFVPTFCLSLRWNRWS